MLRLLLVGVLKSFCRKLPETIFISDPLSFFCADHDIILVRIPQIRGLNSGTTRETIYFAFMADGVRLSCKLPILHHSL